MLANTLTRASTKIAGRNLTSSFASTYQTLPRALEIAARTMASAVPESNALSSKSMVGGYNFASTEYAGCFRDLPKPNTDALRESALQYLDTFDKQKWYDDPVRTCRYIFSRIQNKSV